MDARALLVRHFVVRIIRARVRVRTQDYLRKVLDGATPGANGHQAPSMRAPAVPVAETLDHVGVCVATRCTA